MIRAPRLRGRGRVFRSAPRVVAVPAGALRARGLRLVQDLMVTIRQVARLQVPGQAVTVVAIKPGAITNFNAGAMSSSEVNLLWTLPTSGGVVSGLELNRRITGSGAGGWSGNLLSGIVSFFNDTGRTADTSYDYRLRPVSGASNGDYVTDTATTFPSSGIQPKDFQIDAGTSSWDGTELRVPLTGGSARAVRAGDIIEFEAGTYGRLTLSNIAPAANTVSDPNTDYVVLRGPPTGKATVTVSSGTGDVLNLDNLRFVRIDGISETTAPDPLDGKRRNIEVIVTGSASPTQTVKFGFTGDETLEYLQTRDIVVRGLKIKGNWTGIGVNGARIALSANGPHLAADFPNAMHANMIFEDLLISDVNAEGMYIGHNPYRAGNAQGRAIPVGRCKVRRSMFVNCGGTAINPKSWYGGVNGTDQFPNSYDTDTNNSVHDIVIYRCGTDDDASANPPAGPAISARSVKADFYNIVIEGCGGTALNYAMDEDTHVGFPTALGTTFSTRVYNVIARDNGKRVAAKTALNFTAVEAVASGAGTEFRPHCSLYSCTVASNPDDGIGFAATVATDSFAKNNISVGNLGAQISWGPLANDNASNLVTGAVNTIFEDGSGAIESSTANLHLSAVGMTAAAGCAGTKGVTYSNADFDGVNRPSLAANAHKGAYET